MSVLPTCIHVPCVCLVNKVVRSVLGPLELELKATMSRHVGGCKLTPVPSLNLEPFLRPLFHSFLLSLKKKKKNLFVFMCAMFGS